MLVSRRSPCCYVWGFSVQVDTQAQITDSVDPEALLEVLELQTPILSLLRDEIESEIECCAQIADQMGRTDIGDKIRAMRIANLATLRTIQ